MEKNGTSTISQKSKEITTYGEHFLRMSPDLIVVSRFDGTIEYFNEEWTKKFGYEYAYIKEHSPWNLIAEEDRDKAVIQLTKIAQGETHLESFIIRGVTKKGEIKEIMWSANADVVKGLIYAIGRDVTAIDAKVAILNEVDKKFKFFAENTFEGICIKLNNKIKIVNNVLAEMLGVENEDELIGKNIFDIIAESEHHKIQNFLSQSENSYFETKCKKRNGDYFSVEFQIKPIVYKSESAQLISIKNIEDKKLQQEKILSSELRYQSVFQNNTIGILLIDENRKFVEANNLLLTRLGYTRDEFFKLEINDIIHKSEINDAIETVKNLVCDKIKTTQAERKFIRKNKSIAWSRSSCSLIQLIDGKKLVMVLIEDIESQKKSEKALIESREQFRAVYQSSPMGIYIQKAPGIIIDVNPAFIEMTGFQAKELIGKNILDFIHPSEVGKSQKLLEKIYKNEIPIFQQEVRYVRNDGKTFWVKNVVTQMNIISDEIITVGIIESIDRRKATEHKLEIKNKELLQTNQELEHFAYVASHDLQEPLRTITSFIQILDKRYGSSLDIDGRQFMNYVVEGSKRMQTLIRDLLEYSRINRHQSSYEKVDLNEIYQTVNRVLKDKIDTNDAIILAEHLPVVDGNKIQLTQIFQNLIDNAIKFRGKKNPEIAISVKEFPDKWEFAFNDNGIGISNEYFTRIFIIFQRLHTLEEYSGTGIGLAIVKKIIERHGGDIWVDSKVNKGTTFYFTIAKNLSIPILH